jgi:hypothetical protein
MNYRIESPPTHLNASCFAYFCTGSEQSCPATLTLSFENEDLSVTEDTAASPRELSEHRTTRCVKDSKAQIPYFSSFVMTPPARKSGNSREPATCMLSIAS